MSLFRQEVITARNAAHSAGRVILRSPRLFTVCTALTALLVAGIFVLLLTTDYGRRSKVSGTLVPVQGLARVYPAQAATVMRRVVAEGQHVQAGDVLFVLSNERVSRMGETDAGSLQNLQRQDQGLQTQLGSLERLQALEQAGRQKRKASLASQLAQLQSQIQTQRQRTQLAKETLARYQELAKTGFVSSVQVQQKADEALDQEGKVAELLRSGAQVQEELQGVDSELATAPIKGIADKVSVARDLANVRKEILETEARRETVVTAPVAGTVTALQGEPGQQSTPAVAMATIVPDGARLVAEFYCPSSDIGFVKPGQQVWLRYAAFPYQKFGQHRGTVRSVSRSAIRASNESGRGDNLYRITVQPDEQQIATYGEHASLQPDMQVEADILLDRRKVIEWIFEPLQSMKRNS